MPSFLKDFSKYYGTGERNAAGQTLEEFLESYDPYKYRTPSCTVDMVIFSCKAWPEKTLQDLRVLLVKRGNHPNIGYWALPGGFVDMEENLEDAARRELKEETGVDDLVMEQIGAFGDYDRDPRTRVITTAYMALVQEGEREVHAGDDAADAAWCELEWKEDSTAESSVYRINIKNQEKGLNTAVTVEHKLHDGLIREESFHVKSAGCIAADHGAIIAKALATLERRMMIRGIS